MSEDPNGPVFERLTAEDVAFLNREAMRDAAVRGRIAGTTIMVLGVVGALAWLWIEARTQLNIRERAIPFGLGSEGDDVTLVERVDALAATIGLLVQSAIAFGIGAALTLASNHLTVKYGGTLSGLAEGDQMALPLDAIDLDDA